MAAGVVDTSRGVIYYIPGVPRTTEELNKLLERIGNFNELQLEAGDKNPWRKPVIRVVPKRVNRDLPKVVIDQLMEFGRLLQDPVLNLKEVQQRLSRKAFLGA